MASTKLTINSDVISRAADAIMARGEKPSKNAILNAFAAAAAGPGHDWGFIKNTPGGEFTQAGISTEQSQPAASASAWVVLYDERDDWARKPNLFSSQEAALASIEGDHNWWRHDEHPFAEVMNALRDIGEYTFTREEDDDDDASPYQIWLQELPIETMKPATEDGDSGAASSKEPVADTEMPGPSEAMVLIDAPVSHTEQGMTWDEALFENIDAVNAYAATHNLDTDPDCAGWRERLYRADECILKATFQAEVWVNDYSHTVPPEGEDEWIIDADELEPKQPDLDYLHTSRHAPDWVKDWAGPFEVFLEITPPEKSS